MTPTTWTVVVWQYHVTESKDGEFRLVGVAELQIADGSQEGGRGKGLQLEQPFSYESRAVFGSARHKGVDKR